MRAALMEAAAMVQPLVKVTKAEAAAQAAWAELKKGAKRDRGYWLAIGEGLASIRKHYPSNEQYGKRLKELGLDDIAAQDRVDAMWMAEEWGTVSRIILGTLNHPTVIRKWYREYEARKAELQAKAKSEAEAKRFAQVAKVSEKDRVRAAKLKATASNKAASAAEKEMAKKKLADIMSKTGVDEEIIDEAIDLQASVESFRKRMADFEGVGQAERIKERFVSILTEYLPESKAIEATERLMKAMEN